MTQYTPPQPPAPGVPPAGARGEVPLWAPLYGASLGQAFTRFWKKYARFDGRASRSEYWWWVLSYSVITAALYAVALVVGASGSTPGVRGGSVPGPGFGVFGAVILVWFLATLIPNIAIVVRRLHDTNLSGWLYLISLIPLGGIVVLVLTILESNPAGRRFDRPILG